MGIPVIFFGVAGIVGVLVLMITCYPSPRNYSTFDLSKIYSRFDMQQFELQPTSQFNIGDEDTGTDYAAAHPSDESEKDDT